MVLNGCIVNDAFFTRRIERTRDTDCQWTAVYAYLLISAFTLQTSTLFCHRNGGEIGHLSGRRITQELPCAAQVLPPHKDDCRLCHYDRPGLGKAMDVYGDSATLDQSLGGRAPADLSGRSCRNSNMDKGQGIDGRTPGKVYVSRITIRLCFMLGMLKRSPKAPKD